MLVQTLGDRTFLVKKEEAECVSVTVSDLIEYSSGRLSKEQLASISEDCTAISEEPGKAPYDAYNAALLKYWNGFAAVPYESLDKQARDLWNHAAVASRSQAYAEINLREHQEKINHLLATMLEAAAMIRCGLSSNAERYLSKECDDSIQQPKESCVG